MKQARVDAASEARSEFSVEAEGNRVGRAAECSGLCSTR